MKHVVITGGSRGIGIALARRMLELGCRVTIAGRSEGSARAALDQLLREVPAHGAVLSARACDVTQLEELEALWRHAQALAPIDMWINNAGTSAPLAPLWELSPRDIDEVLETNIGGVLHGSRVAMRGMREQGFGVIYNLEGFGSAGQTFPGVLPYGASKRAVAYISKALAGEARGWAVRVCTIDPGAVRTEMVAATWKNVSGDSALMASMIDALAISAEEVARLLAPRLLDNQRSGVRIRPWNEPVAWLRLLLVPLALLRRAFNASTMQTPRT